MADTKMRPGIEEEEALSLSFAQATSSAVCAGFRVWHLVGFEL